MLSVAGLSLCSRYSLVSTVSVPTCIRPFLPSNKNLRMAVARVGAYIYFHAHGSVGQLWHDWSTLVWAGSGWTSGGIQSCSLSFVSWGSRGKGSS